jgi:hypothetical protein
MSLKNAMWGTAKMKKIETRSKVIRIAMIVQAMILNLDDDLFNFTGSSSIRLSSGMIIYD